MLVVLVEQRVLESEMKTDRWDSHEIKKSRGSLLIFIYKQPYKGENRAAEKNSEGKVSIKYS